MDKKVLWKIYVALIGTATTFAATRIVTGAWKAITGEEPPAPSDPDAPLSQALIWTISSAVGIGVTQVMINRFTARRWKSALGDDSAPNIRPIHVDI